MRATAKKKSIIGLELCDPINKYMMLFIIGVNIVMTAALYIYGRKIER